MIGGPDGSNNTFQLGGTGSDTFNLTSIGAQYQNFTTFNVVSDVWTVSGFFSPDLPRNVNGGTLAGTGTLKSVIVNNGGTLSPGIPGVPGSPEMTIGPTTAVPALTFKPDSTYTVFLNPGDTSCIPSGAICNAGHTTRAMVNGTADLSGGTVNPIFLPGAYRFNTTYTILTATSGFGGTVFSGQATTDFIISSTI